MGFIMAAVKDDSLPRSPFVDSSSATDSQTSILRLNQILKNIMITLIRSEKYGRYCDGTVN